MAHDLSCWRCGASLAAILLPLRRLEECPGCRAELHVCRMCQFFDRHIAKQCRQDDAEEVKEKDRANFCDYFKPRAGAFDKALAAAEHKSRGQLDALFSGTSARASGTPATPAAEAQAPGAAAPYGAVAADALFSGGDKKK